MSQKKLCFDQILEKYIPENELKEIKKILYGQTDDHRIKLNENVICLSKLNDFEVRAYGFEDNTRRDENSQKPRIIRVGAVQNSIVHPTTYPVDVQRKAIHQKIKQIINAAGLANVNILCLQETWPMPFGLITGETNPWCQFAENAEHGSSTQFLMTLAKQHNMVIISPILERDELHGDIIWNTAVVISNSGKYLGKHRKNHIPISYECKYYCPGNTGHPVFETEFGRIAVNICFGRQHILNWMMFGINGAEIVFNPAATTMPISGCWLSQARNAAISNSFYTVAVNRIGSEYFEHEFTTGSNRLARNSYGPYYGSSYIATPDGRRTPSLPTNKDGLLIADIDLNLCQQMKTYFGQMKTEDIKLFADQLSSSLCSTFTPEIISNK